ncbi:AI-2E family transporter [Psittacicella hinzii]|nr:AI-2E family transporter [Psittacicella hinzii]
MTSHFAANSPNPVEPEDKKTSGSSQTTSSEKKQVETKSSSDNKSNKDNKSSSETHASQARSYSDYQSIKTTAQPNHLLNFTMFFILIGFMKYFDDFVNMMLLSIVFAIILRPMVNFLSHRLKLPFFLALFTIFLGFAMVLSLIGLVVNNTINQFLSNIEYITTTAIKKLDAAQDYIIPLIRKLGIDAHDHYSFTSLFDQVNTSWYQEFFKKIWYSLTGFFSGTVIVLLTLVFILIDVDFWQARLNSVLGNRPQSLQHVYDIFSSVSTYIEKKFLLSLLTAICVYVLCLLFGVQFALMWSVLTFAFNFIPNIGVFIVSAPMVVQVFVLNTLGNAVVFTALLTVVHFVTGNIIEPRYMSRHLNLSNTVVWVSLLFWNQILGPIGMLISIPLTTTIRILLAMSPHYKKLAAMMEGEPTDKAEPALPWDEQTTGAKVDPHKFVREEHAKRRQQKSQKRKNKNK